MQKLFLYLQSDDLSQCSWVLNSASGSVEKTVVAGLPDQLRADAADKEIIVIPPAQDVLITEVTLPKLPRYRLLQALPFALEEQLIADVNSLHFAIGDYQASGILPVAIVSKEKMEKWLAALKDIDIFPSVLLPAILAVPLFEASWNIFLIDGISIARTGLYHGFACDLQNLLTLSELELAAATQNPQTIYLQNYTATRLDLSLANANVIEKKLPSEQFLQDIVLKFKEPLINLCQGDFQAKHKPSENKKSWRIAGYLLAAWIGVLFFSNLISYVILHHQSSKIDTQIAGIYTRHFPHATAIVEPKQRLTDKLNSLLNQGGKNHLLLWLSYLGKSLPDATGVRLQQLDYRNTVLALDVTAKNFEEIDKLAKALASQGAAVKQQNAAQAGNEVKGTLIITESKT